jgi:hypothetical protein
MGTALAVTSPRRPRERHRPDHSAKRFEQEKIARKRRLARVYNKDPDAVAAIQLYREEKAKRVGRQKATMDRIAALYKTETSHGLPTLLVGKNDPERDEYE